MQQDLLHRYIFDQLDVRGELVQIENTYQEMIANHNYPAPVQALLGELLVATCLLTATLKFEGEIAVHRTNIEVYKTMPAGIREHSDVTEAVIAELDKLAAANDRLEMIEKYFQSLPE